MSGIDHTTPKSSLTGHNTEVTCVSVLAELGMVVSGSQGKFFLWDFRQGLKQIVLHRR